MSKNQQQKDWYKKTLEKIDNIMSSDKDIVDKYLEIYKYTRIALDGEPTTADEYNKSEGRRGQGYDYGEFEDENDFDVSPDAPVVRLGTLIPENTVRISDINEEIAKEWNRDREERINKKSN